MKIPFDIKSLLIIALCLLPLLARAQLQQNVYEKPATFEDVSDKFIRNMNLLQPLVQDVDVKERMKAVIAQAKDLRSIYGSKNAGKRREEILQQVDEMSKTNGLKDSDQKRLEKLNAELRDLDPDNEFNKGRSQVQKSVSELRELLGQVYISDATQKDILRLVRDHLTYYGNAMGKLR